SEAPASDAVPPMLTALPALITVAPELVEESVVVEELAVTVEAELAVGARPDLSLVAELAEAENLVIELDREVRGRQTSDDGRTDEQLVLAARSGDDSALSTLLTKYRAFARVKARSYFLVGADREDIVQEGMIGLYKAIRDFNVEMESSFRAFAELCVTRQIITAIKTATRQKHGPLNNYVSFSRPVSVDDDGERVLGDVLPTVAITDPADLVISAERIRALQAHFDEVLSDLETEVLRLYVEGKSYQEIAERLQRHVKSIDNALQRIKRKLEGHLRERAVADAG
ncbi:MAG TPA: RNA polymerase sporulation sigma factor SigH, partial [Mycobacteriales bacterium]|nr:RNA polymerase sporulation sigma factor SigH [Mycobacteriales bacterium]